jgi:hypothetical protein
METAQSLLVSVDTLVVCPQCEESFSLKEGFVGATLEQLEKHTLGTLQEVREAERAEASRYSDQMLTQRNQVMRQENDELRRLLAEQGTKHAEALSEVRALSEEGHKSQLKALRAEITDRDRKLSEFGRREADLASKEREIQSRIGEGARILAQSLVASDRDEFQNRIAEQDRQLAVLKSSELKLLHEQQALKDREGEIDNEVARKLSTGRSEIEARVRCQERERAEFDKAELEKRLNDMQEQLAEAQRKGTQRSQQLQGEVLELTLQEDLEGAFPLDSIEEVRKGARGGDVIHRVMTRRGQSAGMLLWETKRAKEWSPQWLTKLKEDMRATSADVGVLVTVGGCFPKDWEEGHFFDLREGVWITSWSTALQLANVLRSSLLDLHRQRVASAGKGEKMEAVYDYLTSSQFSNKLKSVYAAFHRMRQELEAEKNQTLQRWARREKQLQSGVAELVGVAGDIQGLAQQDLPLLEIDSGTDSEAPMGAGSDTSQLGLKIELSQKS